MPVMFSPVWVNSKLGLPLPASRTTSKVHLPEMSAAKARDAARKSRTRVFMRAILSFAGQVRGGLGENGVGLLPGGGIDIGHLGAVPLSDRLLGVFVGFGP